MRRACVTLALAVAACGAPDSVSRQHLLATEAARRLVGAWDVSFVVDTMSTAFRARGRASQVRGTVVFALDRNGPYATALLDGITHDGAYDLDFTPFGFASRLSDAPAVAVARVTASRPPSHGDSLWIVLSPESGQFPVRMSGLFAGDSAAGVWSAHAFSAGGGTGRFVMHRHADSR